MSSYGYGQCEKCRFVKRKRLFPPTHFADVLYCSKFPSYPNAIAAYENECKGESFQPKPKRDLSKAIKGIKGKKQVKDFVANCFTKKGYTIRCDARVDLYNPEDFEYMLKHGRPSYPRYVGSGDGWRTFDLIGFRNDVENSLALKIASKTSPIKRFAEDLRKIPTKRKLIVSRTRRDEKEIGGIPVIYYLDLEDWISRNIT